MQIASLLLKLVHLLLAVDAQLSMVLVRDVLGSVCWRFDWDAMCVFLVVVQSLQRAERFGAHVAGKLKKLNANFYRSASHSLGRGLLLLRFFLAVSCTLGTFGRGSHVVIVSLPARAKWTKRRIHMAQALDA